MQSLMKLHHYGISAVSSLVTENEEKMKNNGVYVTGARREISDFYDANI